MEQDHIDEFEAWEGTKIWWVIVENCFSSIVQIQVGRTLPSFFSSTLSTLSLSSTKPSHFHNNKWTRKTLGILHWNNLLSNFVFNDHRYNDSNNVQILVPYFGYYVTVHLYTCFPLYLFMANLKPHIAKSVF